MAENCFLCFSCSARGVRTILNRIPHSCLVLLQMDRYGMCVRFFLRLQIAAGAFDFDNARLKRSEILLAELCNRTTPGPCC